MYAVIKTGGKQYKVASGDVIRVERLAAEKGATIALDQVLMLGDEAGTEVGTPIVAGASVSAEVVDQVKADKVIIFKKKRRHNYRRKRGHRQPLTVLKITGIARGA
jgi:large subunit ribosomal protein L21